jgi:hypothetical protein
LARRAPFGNPVVPLVSTTTPPGLVGAGNGSVLFPTTMPCSVGTPSGRLVPSSTQVSTRGNSAGSASSKLKNSLS